MSKHSPAVATSPAAKRYTTPAPTSPFVVDLTWIGEDHGWALSDDHGVYETVDGAAHWRRLGGTLTGGISHIRFATATVGYAFGPELFTTADGGRTWSRQASPPVEDLEPAGHLVYRIVYDRGGCPGPCHRTLQVEGPGSTTWRTLRNGFPLGVKAEVVASGTHLYVPIYINLAGGGGNYGRLLRSADGGATWTESLDPCGPHNAAAALAADRAFVAVLCARSSTAVLTSSDGAATWHAEPVPPGRFLGLIAVAQPGRLAVAGGPVYPGGTYNLLTSTADGWTPAATTTGPAGAWLGFEDALVGRWVGGGSAVWTTRDGGAHWTASDFP